MLDELRARGIDYVYLGQRQGSVNSGGVLIDPSLLDRPGVQLIYRADRVWIFALCPDGVGCN